MENHDSLRVSPLIERLLPGASPDEQSAAQANLDHFISVLYRICDRIEREAETPTRDKADGDAKLDTTREET